jgi:hypothetical protein
VFARWRIPAADWQAFLALDAERNARGDRERNSFEPGAAAPAREVEVIVGKEAVQIDGSLHALPRHGMPQVTRAEFDESRIRPSVIELDLDYPGDGLSAPGTPNGPRSVLLRFPVPHGAQAAAKAIVAHFSGGVAEPSFFHGRGDGSDPEDLTECWNCGFRTHRLVASCQRCGASMVSRRWARRYGALLVVLGLFLGVGGSLLLLSQLPILLHPGMEIGDTRFTGSARMANFVILILAGVAVFGLTTLGYGVFQMVTGRRSRTAVRAMLAIVAGLYLIGLAIRSGAL